MKIKRFILYAKRNPEKYISYCELIVLPNGDIKLPKKQCHVDLMFKEAWKIYVGKTKQYDLTFEVFKELENHAIKDYDCLPIEWLSDKYRIVPVWYCGYMIPSNGLTNEQEQTLEILLENKLILKDYVQFADAYHQYLEYSICNI